MSIFSKLRRKRVGAGVVSDEEGFLDLDLPLVSATAAPDGQLRFEALGEIAGTTMGFAIVLHPSWEPQLLDDSDAVFYWGAGAYERTGPESDRFVEFVAARYGFPANQTTYAMLPSIDAKVVGLNTDPSLAAESGASMKFFFHSSSDERYAEVFTNINLETLMLEFHEKDNDYRSPLVRAFCEA